MKKSKLQQSIAAFNIVGDRPASFPERLQHGSNACNPVTWHQYSRTATTAPTSTAAPVPQNLLESQMRSARQAGYLHASYSNAVGGTVLTAAELDTTPFKDGGIIRSRLTEKNWAGWTVIRSLSPPRCPFLSQSGDGRIGNLSIQ